MKNKTALVFGATGLTGSHLVNLLVKNENYHKIKIFLRSPHLFTESEKSEIHVVEISSPEKYSHLITGNDLFCCLGTTIAKAGNQAAFRVIDFEIPLKLAEIATENKVENFIAISSLGANEKSSNFYLRTKGEMEKNIGKFPFNKIAFLRPSILLGERNEFRFGESLGKIFMQISNPFLIGKFRKYRAIHAEIVSKSMIIIANENFKEVIFESDKIQEIAENFTP